jgi:DNA polymerase III gamma/tau subunit
VENDKQWESLLEEAKILHKQGVNGDEDAVKEAYKILKSLRSKTPQNNLIEAYYGSVLSLLGRDATDTMERFRLVRTGLKKLDQAVKKDPKNVEIRILRGYVSYNLPEMFFQRTSTAIEDFEYIVSQYKNDDSTITQGFYWQLLYDLGVAYKRFEQYQDAKTTWLKLLQQKPDQKFITLLEQEGITEELLAQTVSNHVGDPLEEEHISEKLPEPVPADKLSPNYEKESKESIQPNEDIGTTEAEHYEEEKSEKEAAEEENSMEEKSEKEAAEEENSMEEKSKKDKSDKEKSKKEKSKKEKSKKEKSDKEKTDKEKSKKEKSKKEKSKKEKSKKEKSDKEKADKEKSKKERSKKEKSKKEKSKKEKSDKEKADKKSKKDSKKAK